MMELSSSDEDDPVVEEVDVYLSKRLSEHLLLLQYPVRPAHVTYDSVNHLTSRIKPNQLKLEMELAMNTRCPNYARSKGEQIALNVDGRDPDDKALFNSDSMDKQVLTSTPVGVDTGRYVLGTLRDKELHLTPLRGVLQLKPGFNYLDQADLKMPKEAETDAADGEDEAKPVMVKFARQETEDAKARRMASYDYLRKREEEEAWVSIAYHQMDSGLAETERCKLYAQQGKDVSEFYMVQDDYLNRLIPKEESLEDKKPAMPNNVLSMTDLKTMAVGDQVRALLVSAKVIRFSQLMSLLPKGTDATAILRYVQQVALLVQGCWVVKSEVLYPKDSFSAHSGVPAETLGRGRDYIMWRFLHHRFLVRKDISSVIKLPAEDIKDILEQMGRFKVHKGWEFLMDYDQEFVSRHIEVAQRQQMLWDRKFQQMSESLSVTKADLKLAASGANAAALTSPKRRRTTSRNKSGGELSMSDVSDADIEMQRGDRQRQQSGERHSGGRQRQHSGSDRHRNGSGGNVRRISFVDTNDDAAGSMDNGMDVAAVMPVRSIKTEPTSNHSNNVDSAALNTELLLFAAERLHSRFVLSMSDYKRLFHMKLAECTPGHILGSGVSEKQLEQSLLDVGAHKLSYGPNVDSIYIMDKVGDGRDDLRGILVDLLQEKHQVRLTGLRKRVEEIRGVETVSDNELRKLLKDYCVPKGGVWILKCTLQQGDS